MYGHFIMTSRIIKAKLTLTFNILLNGFLFQNNKWISISKQFYFGIDLICFSVSLIPGIPRLPVLHDLEGNLRVQNEGNNHNQ